MMIENNDQHSIFANRTFVESIRSKYKMQLHENFDQRTQIEMNRIHRMKLNPTPKEM